MMIKQTHQIYLVGVDQEKISSDIGHSTVAGSWVWLQAHMPLFTMRISVAGHIHQTKLSDIPLSN
jgi:hypothetical protein